MQATSNQAQPGHTREDLAKMRREYSEISLDETQIPSDGRPFSLVRAWLDEAISNKVTEPNAMCLSTISKEGRPASRYVLLKDFSEQDGSFVWFTNYDSRKGEELALNPFASLVLWWGDMERSIRVEGKVSKLEPALSDAYFQKRPRAAELGAWASHQSAPIESQQALHERFDQEELRFKDAETIPRPETWGGYRLTPDMIEFWKGRHSRLHDRLEFRLADEKWSCQRLQP